MMVGDILAAAARDAAGFANWLEEEDVEMAAKCRAAANGGPLDKWVRGAVTWFELHASADDWATLTTRMRESDAPGKALLATMVERRLHSCECAVQGDAG
ncbi:hypothetical protein [Sphingomicrobium nitratireducens]|uniref:hypothetical protein n=1 Tax=Sphingomicrobium nitratireducens TaxID=2964666 RepID=UPI00223FE239|nr:hypothetical protein [Sphingomicrobium nitratireducens]